MALIRAFAKCSGQEDECLRMALAELSFEGATGHIAFDEFGDAVARPTSGGIVDSLTAQPI